MSQLNSRDIMQEAMAKVQAFFILLVQYISDKKIYKNLFRKDIKSHSPQVIGAIY